MINIKLYFSKNIIEKIVLVWRNFNSLLFNREYMLNQLRYDQLIK